MTASVSFAGTAPAKTDTAPLIGPTIAPQTEGGVITGGEDFTEDWESFQDGDEPCGTNGWEERVSSTDVCGHINSVFSNSGINSLQIVGAVGGRTGQGDDTVQRFSVNGGIWTMKLMTYIQSDASGNGWVIMLNTYPNGNNWSVQVRWETDSGFLVADFDGETTPIIFDEWIQFRVEIDLDADTVDYFYDDNQFIDDKSWADGVTGGGSPTIAALDLYGDEPPAGGGNGVTAFYLDDISLTGTRGACCLPDGSCTDDVPGGECAALGGRFAADTLCEEIEPPCVEQTGACCIEGGGCTRDPVWQCDGDTDGDGQVNPVDSGLVQAHFGSNEDQDLCNYDVDCDGQINPVDSGIVQSLFGTCNAPRDECGGGGESRCEELTATACDAAGGSFLGFGSDCSDDACGFATGACCVDLDCVGTTRQAECDDLGSRWHIDEDCDAGFQCPERSGCEWDNGIIPNGVNARAISPPGFPDIRVADDIVTDGGCFLENLHANIIEDGGWTDGGMVTITVYADTGNGPGAEVGSVTTDYTRVATGDQYFGRDDYEYWAESLGIDLDAGTYWVGLRNPNGGGAGTNYWMVSDGGFDGGGSDTGYFSLDGGSSWQPEGDPWHHAFEIAP